MVMMFPISDFEFDVNPKRTWKASSRFASLISIADIFRAASSTFTVSRLDSSHSSFESSPATSAGTETFLVIGTGASEMPS